MWKERGLIQVRVAQIDTGINSLGGLSPLEKVIENWINVAVLLCFIK